VSTIKRNYYALLLAILNEDYTAQSALQYFGIKTNKKNGSKLGSDEIIKKLKDHLKEGGRLVSTDINENDKLPCYTSVRNHCGTIEELRRELL